VKHIEFELMQRFLAGEADLAEQDTVAEHLACCDQCAALLAQVTADDAALAGALRFDDDEMQWLASVDLTGPVLQNIRPWYQEGASLAVGLLVLAPALWLLNWVVSMITASVVTDTPVGSTLEFLKGLIAALWELNLYLGRGGLLVTIWPALALAAALWLFYAYSKKEDRSNA